MAGILDPSTLVKQSLTSLEQVERNLTVERPDEVALNPISSEAVMIPSEPTDDDLITVSIKDDDLPDAVLKTVLLGLALRDLRLRKEKERKDFTNVSFKRGTLLKFMSETLIQRQALVGGTEEIDLKSPKFREVIKMFLQIIADTFDEIKIPPEYRDLFFQTLSSKMEGWELKAEKVLKNIR
jgi:hypothetical protein